MRRASIRQAPTRRARANPARSISPRYKEVADYLGHSSSNGCTEVIVRSLHTLDAHIRRRLRALLLKQWKRKRFIARRLIRMGARAKTVCRVVYEGRKATWALSHCGRVDYALDRTYFADRGLLSLEQRYREMHRVVVPTQPSLDLG